MHICCNQNYSVRRLLADADFVGYVAQWLSFMVCAPCVALFSAWPAKSPVLGKSVRRRLAIRRGVGVSLVVDSKFHACLVTAGVSTVPHDLSDLQHVGKCHLKVACFRSRCPWRCMGAVARCKTRRRNLKYDQFRYFSIRHLYCVET